MNIIVNLSGVFFIIFIIWWFWLYKPRSVAQLKDNVNRIDIIVDSGVYEPSQIRTKSGKEITLRFIRRDSSPCAEKVIFNDLDISADLPVGKPHDITLTPTVKGQYEFTCQMSMYRGTLIVE